MKLLSQWRARQRPASPEVGPAPPSSVRKGTSLRSPLCSFIITHGEKWQLRLKILWMWACMFRFDRRVLNRMPARRSLDGGEPNFLGQGRDMAGNPDEWAVWLDRHGAALVLFARQRVASRADAEDVVQDAFVRF